MNLRFFSFAEEPDANGWRLFLSRMEVSMSAAYQFRFRLSQSEKPDFSEIASRLFTEKDEVSG